MAFSVDQYQTGGGILYLTRASGGAEFDAGNCSLLTLEPKVDKLTHDASRSSWLTEDKRVTSKRSLTLKATLDTIGLDQLMVYFSGEADGVDMIPLEAADEEYYVRFVPDYASGDEYEVQLWRVDFGSAGAMNLIRMNEWNALELEATVLDDTDNHPGERFGKFIKVTE